MAMAFIATLVLVTAPALEVQESAHPPLIVYVLGKTGIQAPPKNERKSYEKELKNKKKEAERARRDLEKQLKKQYGKKSEKWPEDAQIRYKDAQAVEAAARFQLDYLDCTQKDVDDFVQLLKDAFVSEAQNNFYRDDVFSQDRPRRELEKLKVVRLAIVDLRVSGDQAYVRSSYRITMTAKEGGDSAQDSGNWITVHQRQADGAWKVICDIWNSDNPPSEEPIT